MIEAYNKAWKYFHLSWKERQYNEWKERTFLLFPLFFSQWNAGYGYILSNEAENSTAFLLIYILLSKISSITLSALFYGLLLWIIRTGDRYTMYIDIWHRRYLTLF